jgi:uncharacterized RDD family membrane protein YckC
MTQRHAPPPDYRQRLQVETPEHVTLDLEIAGVGSRALAALIDMLVLVGSALGVFIVLAIFAGFGVTIGSLGSALLTFAGFAVWTGYFILFEGLRRGQTPGKRMVGIRVVSDTGNAVGLGAAVARNLLRIADFLPPPYLIGLLLVALHPRGKRLGDMVAGTVVARDRPAEAVGPVRPRIDPAPAPLSLGPELSDAEFRLLARFESRQTQLTQQARVRLAAAIARRLADHPAFDNAVDVVKLLLAPTDQVPNVRHHRVLHTFSSMTSLFLLIQQGVEEVDEFPQHDGVVTVMVK